MRESMTHPWQVFDMLEGYFWDETSGTPQTFTVVHRTKCFVSVLHTKTGVLHRKKVNMSSDDPFFWLGGLVVRRPALRAGVVEQSSPTPHLSARAHST